MFAVRKIERSRLIKQIDDSQGSSKIKVKVIKYVPVTYVFIVSIFSLNKYFFRIINLPCKKNLFLHIWSQRVNKKLKPVEAIKI